MSAVSVLAGLVTRSWTLPASGDSRARTIALQHHTIAGSRQVRLWLVLPLRSVIDVLCVVSHCVFAWFDCVLCCAALCCAVLIQLTIDGSDVPGTLGSNSIVGGASVLTFDVDGNRGQVTSRTCRLVFMLLSLRSTLTCWWCVGGRLSWCVGVRVCVGNGCVCAGDHCQIWHQVHVLLRRGWGGACGSKRP